MNQKIALLASQATACFGGIERIYFNSSILGKKFKESLL